ncbi:MAG: hypothetical protein RIS94_1114 [Pseudomonadota bacterium]|jgi:hypothetical protein
MKLHPLLCAGLMAALVPASAWADNPRDPTMRSAAARARDRAIIRELNLREAARVRARDARYVEGWRAWREGGADGTADAGAQADYARQRDRYERDMAAWRRAVAACRAGDTSACEG